MAQDQVEKEPAQTPVSHPLSCQNCASFPVCTVYRAIEPMIKTAFTKDLKPFQAEDLAKICGFFLSKAMAKILQETDINGKQD